MCMRCRFIRQTELALSLGPAALLLDMTALPSKVEVEHKFFHLYKPKFASPAVQKIAEREARVIVGSALNRWAWEGLELEDESSEGQEVWTSKSSDDSSLRGRRPETVETSSPLRSMPSSRPILIRGGAFGERARMPFVKP